jgi:hypothetical protein
MGFIVCFYEVAAIACGHLGVCIPPLFGGCCCSASHFVVEAPGNQLEIAVESTGRCRNLFLGSKRCSEWRIGD